MRTPLALIIAAPLLAILAGCTTGSPSPSDTPSSPTPTAKATTLDPCQLVTAAEASQLSGATFGPGKEEATGTNGTGMRCTYGAQTTNVFFVQVASATSASDAQAEWATEEAAFDADISSSLPGNPNATTSKSDLTGLGDKAAAGTLSDDINGETVNINVIYLLKGPNLLAFGDSTVNVPAASVDSLTTQAAISLDRMP
ncbi:MAG: DUF3558 family protein [Leifsonia sp.]